jgi:Putative restriction endonuclease
MRKHDTNNGNGAAVELGPPPLRPGDKLTRAEFMRRWELHPEIKFAELIGGVVYMPSPLSRLHGVTDNTAGAWLCTYRAHTPGTESGSNATTLMEGDETPQPDDYLRILPEFGGRSGNEGLYVCGSPELLVEISASSASIDMTQKFDLYERMGVLEYVAILMYEQEIRWHRLTLKGYKRMEPDAKMIWKSKVFPGLWLDGKAMLANDAAKVLATLNKGLRSPEHTAFVKKLAKKKKR